jgi:DNA primase
LLYGAHHARATAARVGAVVVVEGYIDALAMHQAGIENTVALMGTSVSEHQVAGLKCLAPTVVLMFDGDQAGNQAILRAGALAAPTGLEVLVASLPSGSDPAAMVQRQGAETAREVVAHARAFTRFRVQHHIERSDLSTAEAKDRIVAELRDIFIDIPSSAVREDLIALVAKHLGLERALVSSWMPTRANGVGCQPVVVVAQAE